MKTFSIHALNTRLDATIDHRSETKSLFFEEEEENRFDLHSLGSPFHAAANFSTSPRRIDSRKLIDRSADQHSPLDLTASALSRSTEGSKRLAPRGAPRFGIGPQPALFLSIPHGRATRPSPRATPQRATSYSPTSIPERKVGPRLNRRETIEIGVKKRRRRRKLDPRTARARVSRGRGGEEQSIKKKHVRDHDYLRKGSRSTSIDVVTYL